MRIINQMPYEDCESCKKCLLSVKQTVTDSGERVIYAGCKNEKRCVRKGEKEHED